MTVPVATESAYLLDIYARYRRDPLSVPADWRIHFEEMEPERAGGRGNATDTFGLSGFSAAYEAISQECPAGRR